MIQTALQHIGGIEIYGILSIVLFALTFLGIVGWACCLGQPYLRSMASRPLEPDPENRQPPENSHE